jgi:hypothetical protein
MDIKPKYADASNAYRVRVLGEFPTSDDETVIPLELVLGAPSDGRFKGREWFQDRSCSMTEDDALIAELTAPAYSFTSTGKMVVESKADMKKRGMRIT